MAPKRKAAAKAAGSTRVADEASCGSIGESNIASARSRLDAKLDADPQMVFHLLEMIENGTVSQILKGKADDKKPKTHWHGTQVNMHVIPKYWMEGFLVDLEPKVAAVLPTIIAADSQGTRHLFYAAMGCDGNTRLTVAMHEQKLFAEVMRMHYNDIGRRLSNIDTWETRPNWAWGKLRAYDHLQDKVDDKDMVVGFLHISGQQHQLKDPVDVGGKWTNEWHDVEAFYKVGTTTVFMKDCFDFSIECKTRFPEIVRQLRPDIGEDAERTSKNPGAASSSSNAAAAAEPRQPFDVEMLPQRGRKVKRAVAKVKSDPANPKTKLAIRRA